MHYVRGYFHCVLLLRPEEREFFPCQIKAMCTDNGSPAKES